MLILLVRITSKTRTVVGVVVVEVVVIEVVVL